MIKGGFVEAVTHAQDLYGTDGWATSYWQLSGWDQRKRPTYSFSVLASEGPERLEQVTCTLQMRGIMPRVNYWEPDHA